VPTRRDELETIKLEGHCVRIGLTSRQGPIFYLSKFEHARGEFTTRNVHNGTMGVITARTLAQAIAEGIAHPSKVRGVLYHA
jgi:hypothetical protein